MPATQMSIFILFSSARVLFESALSLPVSLKLILVLQLHYSSSTSSS